MEKTAMMSAVEISFAKQFNGYDKEQVDYYIENLTEAYQTAYEEYNAVCEKYNSLLEKYKTLGEQQKQNKASVDIVSKMLVDAETLAQKIISDANAEAEKTMTETQIMSQKIKEDACTDKAAVKMQAQKLIDDANTEVAVAKEQAEMIISDARAKAAQISLYARQNLEQTDESITQAIRTLQNLLASKTPDDTYAEHYSE
jgi:DivIVA domain-containing protein